MREKYFRIVSLIPQQTNYVKEQQLVFLACWMRWKISQKDLGIAPKLWRKGHEKAAKSAAMTELNLSAKAMRKAWQQLQYGNI